MSVRFASEQLAEFPHDTRSMVERMGVSEAQRHGRLCSEAAGR